MNCELIKDYCWNPAQRDLLNNFTIKIFNLNFTDWEHNGFWDKNYKPISLIENGKIISNVSVYSLQMIIDGKKKRAA